MERSPSFQTEHAPTDQRTSSPEKHDALQKPIKQKRNPLTKNACFECRRCKAKCDGTRPTCARCTERRSSCLYEIATTDMTKMQHLAQQLRQIDESTRVLRTLLNALRDLPYEHAAVVLGRTRAGEPPEMIFEDLQGRGLLNGEDDHDPRDLDAVGEEIDAEEWRFSSAVGDAS